MKQIKVRIKGTRPMLMHAATGANPLDAMTKEHKKLTSKRTKTDDDHEQIAKSEFLMSFYYDKEAGPYIPGINIEASIIAGAKLKKLGSTFKRGAEVLTEIAPLEYNGPRNPEKLWTQGFYDARMVKVSTSKLMRYRPLFTDWELEFEVIFDEEILNKDDVVNCISDAGAYCGIGDYRPKFGRFEILEVK